MYAIMTWLLVVADWLADSKIGCPVLHCQSSGIDIFVYIKPAKCLTAVLYTAIWISLLWIQCSVMLQVKTRSDYLLHWLPSQGCP